MAFREFTILLSASVPNKNRDSNYLIIPDAQVQIEEAVVSLARNVFKAQGRLVFGGHPSITPLVAMVATEYPLNQDIENSSRNENSFTPITIYQSRIFADVAPNENQLLYNLGNTNIKWTDAADGEHFDAENPYTGDYSKSLSLMRQKMITNEHLDALVVFGGMEGVIIEYNLFRKIHPQKPVYLFSTTGGAAQLLSNNNEDNSLIKVIDKNIEHLSFLNGMNTLEQGEDNIPFTLVPYLFLTSNLVEEVRNSSKG